LCLRGLQGFCIPHFSRLLGAISVEPDIMILKVNETETITVTVSPSNATDKRVTFSSSDNNIATIDENGKVTALAGGKATITVTSVADNSKKATVNVVVGDILIPATFADDPILGTIQNEIDKADEESTIVVMPAAYPKTYNEQLVINKSLTLLGLNTALNGTITITADNVTVDGFNVVAPSDYTLPVIHIIDSDDVNIINNTVIAQGYASIGTSTGPARVTGKISGNTVTGMIIVGTDGELEVCENDVTPTSAEGICFYPVGPEAKIIVTGNKIGQVEGDFAQIKVEQKPKSVNGKTNEVDMLSVISEDNNDATVKLAWIKTVGEDAYADYANIQAAIEAATTGDNIIAVYPGEYGTESIDIIQQEGVNITLEAVGEVELKNQIKIDGNARLDGIESLTIRGFTFDFSDKSGDIITTTKKDGQQYAYAHNVSIEDCTFIGNTQSSVVAVRAGASGGHHNFQLDGCTGTNLHSLAQLTSVNGVTVENCTVDVSEGGLNLQNSTDIEINNLTVDGTEYGVRAGQSSGTVNTSNTMTISDSELNAKYPIWLRGDAPGTVVITNSTLEPTDDGERIKNDAGVNVLEDPPVYNEIQKTYHMTIQEAINAATEGDNIIKVYPGVHGTDPIQIVQKEGVNITLEAVGDVVLKNQIIIDGEARAAGTESLTIKGFTFDFTDATDDMGVVDIISTTNKDILTGKSYNYSHNITIEDNIFNGTFDATVVAIRSQSSYNLKIIGCRGEGLFSLGQITSIPDELEVRDCDVTVSEGGINYTGAGNVTIEALKVVGELYGVRAGANNEVIYSGSKLVISGSDLEAKYPVIIRGAAETVTITDSTLTPSDDGKMIDNVANGNINITIDGATYITDANNLMELQNALGKAGTGDQTVMFAKDAIIDMTSQTWTPIKVDGYHGAGVVTIDGNGATITNLSAPLFHGGFAGGSGIVIKNLTIADSHIKSSNTLGSGAFIETIDSMSVITLEKCALVNSSLEGSRTGGLIGWTAGYNKVDDGPVKTYVTIKDCTVEGNTITGTGTTGGIIGLAGNNAWTYHFIENVTVTKNIITSYNSSNKGVASIVGTANVGEVTITNYQANENTVNWTTDDGSSTPNEKVYGRLAFGETGKLIIDGVDITE
jgi:hypothetical protein